LVVGHFAGDLCADLGDRLFDLRFGVQAVSLAHDLTDMLEISGHGALQGVLWQEKRAKVRM